MTALREVRRRLGAPGRQPPRRGSRAARRAGGRRRDAACERLTPLRDDARRLAMALRRRARSRLADRRGGRRCAAGDRRRARPLRGERGRWLVVGLRSRDRAARRCRSRTARCSRQMPSISAAPAVTGRVRLAVLAGALASRAGSISRGTQLRSTVRSDVEPALNAYARHAVLPARGRWRRDVPLRRAARLGRRMVPFVAGRWRLSSPDLRGRRAARDRPIRLRRRRRAAGARRAASRPLLQTAGLRADVRPDDSYRGYRRRRGALAPSPR